MDFTLEAREEQLRAVRSAILDHARCVVRQVPTRGILATELPAHTRPVVNWALTRVSLATALTSPPLFRSVSDPLIVIEEYDKLDCPSRGMLRQLMQSPDMANASLNRSVQRQGPSRAMLMPGVCCWQP